MERRGARPTATPTGSPIASPSARYLQWRVALAAKGEGPVVTSIAAAYLQRNQRPAVSGLVVHPPGVVFQKPFSTGETEIAGYRSDVVERRLANQGQPPPSTGAPTLGRRTYQQGLQTLVWKGDDANGDDLTLRRRLPPRRRHGLDARWPPRLTDPIYVWDTTAVPSGTYVLRDRRQSDAPSQAGRQRRWSASSSRRSSRWTTLPPAVTAADRSASDAGRRLAVTVEVRDDQSAVGAGRVLARRRARGCRPIRRTACSTAAARR